ncbi:IS110 family transposase [Brevibacterium sp. GP-SGM9]|uniref:IS110 family transposase n=1 Tax=Brevibacterium sp. GP-SGM9 TaxID=3376990 RepID=UPI0039A5E688
MFTPSPVREVVGGVDTHKDTHFAAVITTTGQHLAATQFPATSAGYEALIAFITSFGVLLRIGVEGTNSYGAGLTRRLERAGITVLEVLQPGRGRQGTRGKTDEIDAYRAAESALAQVRCAQPKNSQGLVEQMRIITIARTSAVSARAEALTQISNILITAPDDLRERYRNMPTRRRLQMLGRMRCGGRDNGVIVTTKRTLKSLATRIRSLSLEIDEHDETLKGLINTVNPSLLQTRGIGVISAAVLLISAGDNPDRLANEAQFAMHTGAAPIPASSGQTMRYRLNRGGDRKANHALHTIAIVRLHTCPRTRAYVVRRKSECKSPKDIWD